jgi:hypothetical protein
MGTVKTVARLSLAAALLAFAFATPAKAGSVLSSCEFTVTGTVAPGSTVTVQGTGFQPDAELPISVNGTIVATVVIADGGVLPPTDITIPDDAQFPITIEIPCGAGEGSGVATSTFQDPDVGDLAFTGGSDTGTYVGIGILAVAIGGVLVFGTRRRAEVRARQLQA